MPERFRLGFGAAVIAELPSGVRMGGYAGRTARSTGTHDPLTATALVLEDGDRRVALISIDAVIVSAELKRRAVAAIGMDTDSVLLAASHTHSGPGGDQLDLLLSRAYYDIETMDAIVAAIRRAVAAAGQDLRECRVELATGTVAGIASDRVLGAPSVPAAAAIARCSDDRGQVVGVIANYACHPTVLDEGNTELSADYVAGLRARIRERTGAQHVLFLNGACGDLSTRFSRRASTHAEAARLGELLADQLCALGPGPDRCAGPRTALQTVSITNRRRGIEPAAIETTDPRALAAAEYVRGVEAQLGRIEGLDRSELPLHLIEFGPVRLLGLSVELFHRLRPEPGILLACYANAHHGYAVAPDTPAGAYERLSTLLPDSAGMQLVARARELLQGFS